MPIPSQIDFLKSIQSILPANYSLVQELADILDISTDSVYRRLRGEKELSYSEITKICHEYKVSFDDFVKFESGERVCFRYQLFDDNPESFRQYFMALEKDIKTVKLSTDSKKHVWVIGQGIPLFYYLKYRRLTAFKIFYWMRSIVNVSALQHQIFPSSLVESLLDDQLSTCTSLIYDHYIHLPSTEVWTHSTVMGTLHQIEFYWDSGHFASKQDALAICEDVRDLLKLVQKTAELGFKVNSMDWNEKGGPCNLYFSEIEFENNCILVEVGDMKKTYLGQHSFGSLATENHTYYDSSYRWVSNILRKSNLISNAAESLRYQYFKKAHKQLERLIEKIDLD